MTTPRVTENPLRLAAVERDPFADAPQGWRNPLERQTDLVREIMRAGPKRRRAARTPRQMRTGTTAGTIASGSQDH
jgi:hypothetical protein